MKYFPSWRYHRTLEAKIVKDEAEDAALGEGWAHTPAAFESDETYREHMAQWESKDEKKAPKPKRGRA